MINMPEETVFTEALGNTPIIRTLGYLIIGRGLEYSISDIADGGGVGWTTLHYILPELEKKGLVKQTRNIGRAKMYTINLESLVAQQLILLFNNLLNISIDEVIEKQAVKH